MLSAGRFAGEYGAVGGRKMLCCWQEHVMLLTGAVAGADTKHSAVWVFCQQRALLSACRLRPSLKAVN